MGLYAIKPAFQKILTPVCDFCITMKITADHLNLAGLVSSGMMGTLFVFGKNHPTLFLAVPLFVFIRLATNALDGMVARKTGASSAIGEVHNEVLDRISDAVVILSIGMTGLGSMQLSSVVCAFMMLGSFIGLSSKAAGGRRIYDGVMGKPDRMVVVGALSFIAVWYQSSILWNAGLGFMAAGALISCLQRYMIARRELTV